MILMNSAEKKELQLTAIKIRDTYNDIIGVFYGYPL